MIFGSILYESTGSLFFFLSALSISAVLYTFCCHFFVSFARSIFFGDDISTFLLTLGKPQKSCFLVGRLRPYPPPLELSGHIYLGIFLEFEIKFFFFLEIMKGDICLSFCLCQKKITKRNKYIG